eukprot:8108003-Pyramimonas_sp.AAC.1
MVRDAAGLAFEYGSRYDDTPLAEYALGGRIQSECLLGRGGIESPALLLEGFFPPPCCRHHGKHGDAPALYPI